MNVCTAYTAVVCTAYTGVIEQIEFLLFKLCNFIVLTFVYAYVLILSLLVLTLYFAFGLLNKHINKQELNPVDLRSPLR
jgi:hypothetical protein